MLNDQLELNRNKKYFCRTCLNYTTRDENCLIKHEKRCGDHELCTAVMPNDEEAILEFKHIERTQRVPYVIYCDFESTLERIESEKVYKDNVSYTKKIHHHVPVSYGIYVKSIYNDIKNPLCIHKSLNAEEDFIKKITEYAEEIGKLLKKNEKITSFQKYEYNSAETCYLCKDKFSKRNYKVRDHDHLTGKYRGAACNQCNLKFRKPSFVPVFFHNLSAYDSHLFIKKLGSDKSDLKLVADNEEKCIAFSKILKLSDGNKIELRFLDSYRFQASSLDTLSSNLEPDQLPETKTYFSDADLNVLFRKTNKRIIRKGIYP